jgi:hypothetical protein
MPEIIICVGCGSEIYDFEDRLTNEYGDWHFECWDEDEDENEDDL